MRTLKGNANWTVVEITDINAVVDRYKEVIKNSRFDFEFNAKCSEDMLRNYPGTLWVQIDKDGDAHFVYNEYDDDVATLMGDNIFDGCVECVDAQMAEVSTTAKRD